MHPLIELGPLRLSSGGLLLVAAAYLWLWLFERSARRVGGADLAGHAAACGLPALLGAVVGGRIWFGLLSLDLYGQAPGLFVALRLADLAWPGALLGGGAVGWLWARWRGADQPALAEAAALALPLPIAVGAVGLLLSGEAFGTPTGLPWGVPLHGAVRHPTQLYYALAALFTAALMRASAQTTWLFATGGSGRAWPSREPATESRQAAYEGPGALAAARRGGTLAPGTLAATFLLAHGLSLLLVEALRADSLTLTGGVRAAQVFGLGLALAGLWALRPGRAAAAGAA